MKSNQEIADILNHIAEILSVQGENPFKIRAYTKASQTIQNLTYPLSSLGDMSKIAELPGIGEGIAKKMDELLKTGRLKYYEDLKKSEYAALTEFLKIPGIGPKHAKLIYEDSDRWRIVFVLAAGHAARTHQLGNAIASVTKLCPVSINEVVRISGVPIGLKSVDPKNSPLT